RSPRRTIAPFSARQQVPEVAVVVFRRGPRPPAETSDRRRPRRISRRGYRFRIVSRLLADRGFVAEQPVLIGVADGSGPIRGDNDYPGVRLEIPENRLVPSLPLGDDLEGGGVAGIRDDEQGHGPVGVAASPHGLHVRIETVK